MRSVALRYPGKLRMSGNSKELQKLLHKQAEGTERTCYDGQVIP
jgi:hypothetical protein